MAPLDLETVMMEPLWHEVLELKTASTVHNLNVTVTNEMAGKTIILCLTANGSDQTIQFSTTITIGMKA